MTNFTESTIEQAAIDWLKGLGYAYAFGPDLAFDGTTPERKNYEDVILFGRLREAIARLNPNIPPQAQEEAFRRVTRQMQPSFLLNNHAFHRMMIEGVTVEFKDKDGRTVSKPVQLIDFENPDNNDWLVVNQYTVEASYKNAKVNRRPDVVIFVNGLPLSVIELKNAADENATIWSAFNQLQTYKEQIPDLFVYNELLIVSDGLNARIGSLTADREWFLPWKTIEGESTAPPSVTQLEVLLLGVFEKRRFLDLIRYFVVFEQDRGAPTVKKIAGYHQFHAVNVAVEETIRAARAVGTGLAPVQLRELKGVYKAHPMKDTQTMLEQAELIAADWMR